MNFRKVTDLGAVLVENALAEGDDGIKVELWAGKQQSLLDAL